VRQVLPEPPPRLLPRERAQALGAPAWAQQGPVPLPRAWKVRPVAAVAPPVQAGSELALPDGLQREQAVQERPALRRSPVGVQPLGPEPDGWQSREQAA